MDRWIDNRQIGGQTDRYIDRQIEKIDLQTDRDGYRQKKELIDRFSANKDIQLYQLGTLIIFYQTSNARKVEISKIAL